jgi:colanic acid biosynthesis glycosyl transferase WcaI
MARILMHTLVFPPDANSNGYIFGDLARELRTLGHDIVVLTTTPHYAIEPESLKRQPLTPARGKWLLQSSFDGMRCYHIAVPAVKGGFRQRIMTAIKFHGGALVAGMSAACKCDIVLTQSPPLSIGLVSAWIAKRHGAKSIYIAQDLFPDGPIRQGKIRNPIVIRFLRWLERTVFKHSDVVCSISDGLVESLRPRIPAGKPLKCIPNFVNTELYRPLPRRNEFSSKYGLDDRFVVSYVGNLGNAQDFSPVFAAAEALQDRRITFLLVGSGIKEKALASEIASRRLHNIMMPGYQPRELTPMINAASDVCLVLLAPHVQNASFPSKIYTLMASGRPVLLYGDPTADAAKFVQSSGVGWVVPNNEAAGFTALLDRLYQYRQELEAPSRKGVDLVQRSYTAAAVAKEYSDLITSVLPAGAR